VELAEDDFFIGEDREKYARALDAKTDEYLDSLRRLEEKCTRADADRDAILDELVLLNDAMMDACFEFEKAAGHDPAILEKSRMLFHEKTDSLLSKSNIFRHARTWPRGCQGDYKMLETLYRNIPLSEGIGYYIDRYGLSLPLAEAVRNRIQVLEEILREELRNRQSPAVLNMACGSCRELMGLAPDIVRSGASVVCIDHDGDSLAFALDRLSYTEAAGQIEFRKYNAIRMFDDELNRSEFGTQDIIYSVGLFDYLPSDFLVKMFAALYRLLNPGGMLIAAFKDAAQYRSQDFHWFVAWDGFLQRTEYEFRAVLHDAGIPANAMKERRDETGIIIFYEITRNEA
jgi:SAM-dependent methyltransferase